MVKWESESKFLTVDIERSDADQRPTNGWSTSGIFTVIVISNILVNFDGGAVPAVLNQLVTRFELGFYAQGALGSLPYLGLGVVSPYAGVALQKNSVKHILAFAMFWNCVATCLFSMSLNQYVLLSCRMAVGCSQAFAIIFFPVWVDMYAPADKAAGWMSIIQVAVPLGIMLGYLAAGISTSMIDSPEHLANPNVLDGWRYPFIFQGVCLMPMGFFFLNMPPHLVYDPALVEEQAEAAEEDESPPIPAGAKQQSAPPAVQGDRHRLIKRQSTARLRAFMDDSAVPNTPRKLEHLHGMSRLSFKVQISDGDDAATIAAAAQSQNGVKPYKDVAAHVDMAAMSPWEQTKLILNCKVFMWTVMALSSIFFVVTGIQYWITRYLTVVIGMDIKTVLVLFSVVSATGPTFGVITGGAIVDRLGGYRNHAKCAGLCCIFGFCGMFGAVPAAFATTGPFIVMYIWVALFFGGCMLSPTTGMLMSSVPPGIRSFASAFSMMIYNVFGYMAAPMVGAVVMKFTEPRVGEIGSIRIGFQVVVLWAVLPMFLLLGAFVAARRIEREHRESSERRSAS